MSSVVRQINQAVFRATTEKGLPEPSHGGCYFARELLVRAAAPRVQRALHRVACGCLKVGRHDLSQSQCIPAVTAPLPCATGFLVLRRQ